MLLKRSTLSVLALAALLVLFVGEAAFARRTTASEARLASLSRSSTLEPGCCAPEPVCCPPHIKYHHKGPKLCCGCKPGQEIVLTVCNPCTGCETQVPVCLPACCEGEPSVCPGKGFLCRDTVEYEWCCGFYVRVAFKRCGDLVVTTWGR